jgi:hypothetical protein
MSAYSNIQSLFKRRYGPYVNPIPSDNTIAQYMSFVPQNLRPGEDFRFPVQLTLEHGVTHNVDETAFTISSVIDSTTGIANLDGSTVLIAGNIPYDVISKAMNGDSAYFPAMDYKIKALTQSAELYRELNLMYGGGTDSTLLAELGTVSASVSGADLGTPQVVNLTRATWSPGVWNTMVNGIVDIYQSDGSTERATGVTVTAIDPTQNRITLTKSGSSTTVATGDVLVARGSKAKQCVGVKGILQNTGSLFGISAATYPLWRSLIHSAGSTTLSIATIQQMGAKLANNGLTSGGKLFVSAATFADLVAELQADDRYNNPGADAKQTGHYNLLVKTSAGPVDVAVHKFQQQGFAYFLAKGIGKRVGSTDNTFSLPGTNKWFYVELESSAGCQVRVFSNQAPILTVPYHCAIVNNIQNNGDTTPA